MKVIPTEIPDVLLLEPSVFEDERGYFFESYNERLFANLGLNQRFMQDNQSRSRKGTLRGLHFQAPPFEQGKLVRVVSGSILDVAVDIRKGSPWFGKWVSAVLNGDNKHMLWIPPGFAHGFLALEDNSVVSYKCTQVYERESEMSIRWNDPELAIEWGIDEPFLSAKDSQVPFLADTETPFIYISRR
jgi:dTDP-4-dehydrorhamnose 3,5-epimerase